MSEDKDKKINKKSEQLAERSNDTLSAIATQNEKSSKSTQRMEDIASVNLKISEAMFKLQQEPEGLSPSRAKELQRNIARIEKQIGRSNASAEEVKEALQEANSISDQLSNIQESNAKNLETAIANDDTLNGLKLLNETLSEQNAFQQANAEAFNVEKSIKKLEGFFGTKQDETTQQLRSAFIEAQASLEKAIEEGDNDAAELAKRQLEAISSGAETEENRREAAKLAEKQSGALFKIGDKLEGLGEKMDAMGLAAKGGFLAGIAGLFLMFTDPEKFKAIITDVMGSIDATMNTISALFQGEGLAAFDNMEGHVGTFMGIVGSIAFLFAGKIVALLGGAFKKLQTLVKAVQVFRLFMMGTFIPGMIATFTTMIASITPMLAALAPILLPIAAIAAVFGLIYLGLEKMRESLGFTSIFDVLMLGLAHLKDAFGHIVNTVGSIVNFIMGLVEKFGRFLGFDIDIPEIPKMDVDNAAKKKAELVAKAEEAELERQRKEHNEMLEKEIESSSPNLENATDLETLQSEATDLNLDSKRDKPINNVNQIQQNTTKGGDNVSTSVFHLPPSPAAYALGDLGGR